ncbi:hypothetical protein ACICHK_05635 [Streptomyces sp. AHU1]|uniref:hypothetical protein n=1 Tax=Streptomyces sp. AHU1 TaxID=3377215 RepID=UPI003877E828
MATSPTVSGSAPADSRTGHIPPGTVAPRLSSAGHRTRRLAARDLLAEPRPHGDVGRPRAAAAAEPFTVPDGPVRAAPAHRDSRSAPPSPFPSSPPRPGAPPRHGLWSKAVLPSAKGRTAGRDAPLQKAVRVGGLRSGDTAAGVPDRFPAEETARSVEVPGAPRYVGAHERFGRRTARLRPVTARLPRLRADVARRLP